MMILERLKKKSSKFVIKKLSKRFHLWNILVITSMDSVVVGFSEGIWSLLVFFEKYTGMFGLGENTCTVYKGF